MSHLHDEERGGYMGKSALLFIIIFLVLGIAIIDGGSILFGRLQLQDIADAASSEAASEYKKSSNPQQALAAAETIVAERDPTVKIIVEKNNPKSFAVDPQTGIVTLTVEKDAHTLFIGKIGPLKSFAHLETTSRQAPPTL